MNARFPTVVLLITASVYAGISIWLFVRPAALLEMFGIETSTAQMLTEIRAFYGGLEFGIALVMLILWRRGEVAAGLLAGGLISTAARIGDYMGWDVSGFRKQADRASRVMSRKDLQPRRRSGKSARRAART